MIRAHVNGAIQERQRSPMDRAIDLAGVHAPAHASRRRRPAWGVEAPAAPGAATGGSPGGPEIG